MAVSDEYQKIYFDEIISKSKGIILKYSPVSNRHEFCPFSHAIGKNSVEDLGKIMRQNLLFYCYGEDEIVKFYKRGNFKDLETAAQYAYKMRLPTRPLQSDGLPSEVLLDLLIQIYIPDSYKLAVRPLLRQQDNNEIKGYDLTYFSLNHQGIGLWLGQAKLGEKNYCKNGIHKDLLTKFKCDYLCKQMFFVCDKSMGTSETVETLINVVNDVNRATIDARDTARQKSLLACFKANNISIYIPCLMAYGSTAVYQSAREIY